MTEYIKREKVYEMLNDLGGCGAEPDTWADGWDKAIDAAIGELYKLPAADVQGVKHGHWENSESPYVHLCKCSVCKAYYETETNYCPRCGAKMDGKEGKNG